MGSNSGSGAAVCYSLGSAAALGFSPGSNSAVSSGLGFGASLGSGSGLATDVGSGSRSGAAWGNSDLRLAKKKKLSGVFQAWVLCLADNTGLLTSWSSESDENKLNPAPPVGMGST